MFGSNFFSNNTFSGYDWNFLKTTGTIVENKKTDKKTGLVTVTKTYTSNDGFITIESTESYYDTSSTNSKYAKLKSDLNKAVEDEDYLKAAKIKEEIVNLTKTN